MRRALAACLVSLMLWGAVTVIRLVAGVVTVTDWSNWALALAVSFTTSATFGYSLARLLDEKDDSEKVHNVRLVGECACNPKEEDGKA